MRKNVYFVWQGISGRYGVWRDGLYAAMKHIEKVHDVTYVEPWEEIPSDAIVLYWESACTIQGKDGSNYKRIQQLPNKKALLFAGGPVQKEWFFNFDHVFVEGEFNAKEMEGLGIPYSIAFGVNEEIFKPEKQQKVFDGFMQATFAGWKRQPLFAEALGQKGLLCGRYQEEDQSPWVNSSQSVRLPELPAEAVSRLINASHAVVNTSEYWGGGQRCTCESLACGIPAIVMSDSPKNMEFIEESGFGLIVNPEPQAIREAVDYIKSNKDKFPPEKGVDYIKSKLTSLHYATALLEWIEKK